jgi:septum formation protein
MTAPLILASTSPYRAELLQKLRVPFSQQAPDCDETPQPNESAAALVERLAIGKAQSLATAHSQAIVIGSDQVADLNGQILGKPGDHETAVMQLQALSGQTLVFYTGLAVVRHADARSETVVVPTRVAFRPLSDEKIERYLRADEPYNCAGSFKSESLGAALVESMSSDDPSALIGLPLIKLSIALEKLGVELP